MKTIWKFPLAMIPAQFVAMPEGAVVLSAQIQADFICLWAAVDATKRAIENRTIFIVGTGWPIPEPEKVQFLATIQTDCYVWHIFAERAAESHL